METIKFEKDELIDIQQAMISEAHNHVKFFISDLVIDFHKMERLNDKDELPSKMIFLLRDNGVEFEEYNSPRIKYWADYNEEKYNQDYRWYIIDFGKYKSILDRKYNIPHYNLFVSTNCRDEEEMKNYCCIFKKDVKEIRNFIKEGI